MAQEEQYLTLSLTLGFDCTCVSSQRQGKVQETQLKCTKARNDYLLNLAAANVSMNKYYLQDICTLIDVSLKHCCPITICLDTLYLMTLGFSSLFI